MKNQEKNIWAKKVLDGLKTKYNLQETKFVILAGKNYYENLIPFLPNYELPKELLNLPIGKRVQMLNKLAPKD